VTSFPREKERPKTRKWERKWASSKMIDALFSCQRQWLHSEYLLWAHWKTSVRTNKRKKKRLRVLMMTVKMMMIWCLSVTVATFSFLRSIETNGPRLSSMWMYIYVVQKRNEDLFFFIIIHRFCESVDSLRRWDLSFICQYICLFFFSSIRSVVFLFFLSITTHSS
jgi:hypothetical protein